MAVITNSSANNAY